MELIFVYHGLGEINQFGRQLLMVTKKDYYSSISGIRALEWLFFYSKLKDEKLKLVSETKDLFLLFFFGGIFSFFLCSM